MVRVLLAPMFRSLPRVLLFACTVFTYSSIAAGPLQKAFAALEVHDYFLARKLFQKQIRKHPAAAWFGLSTISGRANNPFFHVDSCYAFITRADAAFTAAPDKERAYIGKMGVDDAAINVQKLHAFGLAWEVAKGVNSIAAYDRYINTYLQSPYMGDATLVRDHLAFEEARTANTAVAYEQFLQKYPSARSVYEARSRYNEALYREATTDGTLAAFTAFIVAYPESPYVQQAEAEVFRLATPDRTAAEYRTFIFDHPKNHKVNDAWRAIYEQYTRDLSTGSITRFLQEFPDYPFVEELVDDYKTASLVLLPFRRDGKWGFIDDGGTERIKAEYEWVEPFEGAQALVGLNGRMGTVNRSGRVVVAVQYDDIADAAEGTSTVERGEHVGAVDRSGTLVVPMLFQEVGEFSGGLAYAAKDGSYGYINARGETIIPFAYLSAGTFRNGIAVVEMEGGYGAIDVRGNVVVPPQYDWVEGFDHRASRMRRDGRMGLIDRFGTELLALEFEHIGPFIDSLALVVKGSKCGYVDLNGRMAVPMEYDAPEAGAGSGDFNNGLAEVRSNGKRCLINTRNHRVFPCQFADIGAATGALTPVRKKGKWGYADRKGNLLFDNKYDGAWEMIDGIARVQTGGMMGLIDSTGKEIVAPAYTELIPAEGRFIARTAAGTGLIDRSGKVIVPLEFTTLAMMSDELARVELNERFGYLRIADGRFIWREEGFDTPTSP